jgi:hypothetical protein
MESIFMAFDPKIAVREGENPMNLEYAIDEVDGTVCRVTVLELTPEFLRKCRKLTIGMIEDGIKSTRADFF